MCGYRQTRIYLCLFMDRHFNQIYYQEQISYNNDVLSPILLRTPKVSSISSSR